MSLLTTYRYRELLRTERPDDDDFDERLDGQREAERGDGETGLELVASLSPEEES